MARRGWQQSIVLSYRTGRLNTLSWSAPPADLTVNGPDPTKGEVELTLSASSDQEGPLVGGWWNINCEADKNGKGDKSAGTSIGYRATGNSDPHSASYSFKFAPPAGREATIQFSGGNDFSPKLWVLVTYKY